MKKFLAMLIVLFTMVPSGVLAEEAIFTLRSGYRWGMTEEEVAQLAQEEELIFVPDEHAQIFQNAVVGGYPVEMLFGHGEEGLESIRYRFMPLNSQWDSEANTQMYNELLTGLTKTYGEPAEHSRLSRLSMVIWELKPLDTDIVLTLYDEGYERARGHYCLITYSHIPEPTPTPTPTPEPTLLPNDGF